MKCEYYGYNKMQGFKKTYLLHYFYPNFYSIVLQKYNKLFKSWNNIKELNINKNVIKVI